MEGIVKYVNLGTAIACFGWTIIACFEEDLSMLLFSLVAGTAYLELYFLKRNHEKTNRRN